MKLTWFWRCLLLKPLEGACSRKSRAFHVTCSVFQDPFGCFSEALRVVAPLEVSFFISGETGPQALRHHHVMWIFWGWRGFHSRMVKSHHTDRAGKGQRNSISQPERVNAATRELQAQPPQEPEEEAMPAKRKHHTPKWEHLIYSYRINLPWVSLRYASDMPSVCLLPLEGNNLNGWCVSPVRPATGAVATRCNVLGAVGLEITCWDGWYAWQFLWLDDVTLRCQPSFFWDDPIMLVAVSTSIYLVLMIYDDLWWFMMIPDCSRMLLVGLWRLQLFDFPVPAAALAPADVCDTEMIFDTATGNERYCLGGLYPRPLDERSMDLYYPHVSTVVGKGIHSGFIFQKALQT